MLHSQSFVSCLRVTGDEWKFTALLSLTHARTHAQQKVWCCPNKRRPCFVRLVSLLAAGLGDDSSKKTETRSPLYYIRPTPMSGISLHVRRSSLRPTEFMHMPTWKTDNTRWWICVQAVMLLEVSQIHHTHNTLNNVPKQKNPTLFLVYRVINNSQYVQSWD